MALENTITYKEMLSELGMTHDEYIKKLFDVP